MVNFDALVKMRTATTNKEFAKAVCAGLEESQYQMIEFFVRRYGRYIVHEEVCDTVTILLHGGMLTKDRARNRTPGGILSYLMKKYK